MTETLDITRMGQRGDGVADTSDGPVFVAYALPGETVEVEAVPGQPDRRQLVRIATPSLTRVTPFCPHFGVCGGCAIQHWSDEPYRAWKRDLVVTALAQAGIEAPVDDLIDAHGEGRRRATFHARRGPDGKLRVGFSEARSHQVVALDACPVLAPLMQGALAAARGIAEALLGRGKPLDIQMTATDNGIDVDVRGSGAIGRAETAALARLAETHRLARITRHGELVTQRAAPAVLMGKARLVLPPGSFLQATQAGEETLARLVVMHTAKAKTIADLFCGTGPFALRLAETARVTAIDGDAAAIESLQQAAAATPGLRAIAVQRRDLFRRPLTAAELKAFGAVIFDPPRQGAQAQARELATSRVSVVVAVSCNAGTFARDARTLIDGGYRLAQVTPVDQFRHSAHVEIVAKFVW